MAEKLIKIKTESESWLPDFRIIDIPRLRLDCQHAYLKDIITQMDICTLIERQTLSRVGMEDHISEPRIRILGQEHQGIERYVEQFHKTMNKFLNNPW